MSDITKIWLTADALLADSFRLARAVLESGFRPTHLVGIWRGGAPIGIAVQEFFDVHGVECDHIAIRTASYSGIDRQARSVKVYALGYLIDTLNADDRLLIIDDVFDSGRSIEAVLAELKARCRANLPADIRIATVWYKPARNQTALTPDYFIHESNDWLVFPHEIDGLTADEIRAHKPAADVILAPIKGLTA
ncbi:hypoxanthine phosphoribosyltransferase [Sandarakinorhabdus cyanobacteriorum]|uniref:Hypoxanthine phosphoribosyltransferase n=1 Tax=Sandarakinorhabdus cyanobacteriorum TaxID=1981098 RepID=A0A255YLC6_9SPHN|nr:phosphoribosyltransferase family protein [Sandarakinorhabdus cyanobacteriorum]OYQ30087.1 hypoxanthine phosphoribosyltransferase [Sandarakinorhabdus cyanobacteriorum]